MKVGELLPAMLRGFPLSPDARRHVVSSLPVPQRPVPSGPCKFDRESHV